jgi:UDP-N-acetylglucosamine:LPS N-acetylglucosamine transferase
MGAIADALISRGWSPQEITFVGSRRGKDRHILGSHPVRVRALPGRGFARSWSARAIAANLGAALGLVVAVLWALVSFLLHRPTVVVSVGGYASFPASAAAVLLRCAFVTVELDATPSAAQRVLTRFARARCCAFATDDPRSVVTGVPVRYELERIERVIADGDNFLIDAGRESVVVMTGSLGARRVNDAVVEWAADRPSTSTRHVTVVTGQRDFERIERRWRDLGSPTWMEVVAYADMATLWPICDVALCRAGATTVAELTLLAVPSVLVPLPGAPGDHQRKNALALERAGACVLVDDANVSAEVLRRQVDRLFADADTRRTMSDAARRLGRPQAADRIVDVICDEVLGERVWAADSGSRGRRGRCGHGRGRSFPR